MFTRHLSSAALSVAAMSGQLTQDKKLNSFHLRCVRHMAYPGRTWSHTQSSWSMLHAPACTPLSQRWLGHVHRMANGRITNDILYGELVTGTHTNGRPYISVTKTPESMTRSDRGHWRSVVKTGTKRGKHTT